MTSDNENETKEPLAVGSELSARLGGGTYLNFNTDPPHKVLGYWELRTGFEGSFGVSTMRLTMYRKPSWITRYLMKRLMEIHWVDA